MSSCSPLLLSASSRRNSFSPSDTEARTKKNLVAIEYEKEGPVEEDLRQQVDYARRLA